MVQYLVIVAIIFVITAINWAIVFKKNKSLLAIEKDKIPLYTQACGVSLNLKGFSRAISSSKLFTTLTIYDAFIVIKLAVRFGWRSPFLTNTHFVLQFSEIDKIFVVDSLTDSELTEVYIFYHQKYQTDYMRLRLKDWSKLKAIINERLPGKLQSHLSEMEIEQLKEDEQCLKYALIAFFGAFIFILALAIFFYYFEKHR